MPNIVVIGDLMLDKYSYGAVKRLNPEGPNPLLNIEKEEYKLGGASNVAANISSLQGSVSLIGVLGNDSNGKIFSDLCKENNIQLSSIYNGFPTITKQRFIETTYQQQLLRVDYEKKYELFIEYIDQIIGLLHNLKPEYIVISDYNKGIINKKFTDSLKEFAKENNSKILTDTKPNNVKYFQGTYLLKPNFKEFKEMIGEEINNEDEDIEKHGKIFVKENSINLVITRGSKGAVLITKDAEFYSIPTNIKQVFDVTGAGDTFLATIVYALSKGYDIKSAVEFGNKASGVVVGKIGTAVITPQELNI